MAKIPRFESPTTPQAQAAAFLARLDFPNHADHHYASAGNACSTPPRPRNPSNHQNSQPASSNALYPAVSDVKRTSSSSSTMSKGKAAPKTLTPDIMGHEVVKLYIGRKRKEFTIHKKLLCDQIDFFSKKFNGRTQEAKTGVMYLPEDHPDEFASLIDFLYRGAAPDWEAARDPTFSGVGLNFLAEKYCMPELQDRTVDAIRALHRMKNMCYSTEQIDDIFHSGSKDNKLRLLAVAEVAFRVRHYIGDKDRGYWYLELSKTCPEFFVDLFRFQIKYAWHLEKKQYHWSDALAHLDPCTFHVHENDAACYLKKAS